MNSKGRGRPGITTVELIVVVAILGVLVAVLLPAVMSSRAAARLVSCSSRMREVTLATHQYETSWNAFPQNSGLQRPYRRLYQTVIQGDSKRPGGVDERQIDRTLNDVSADATVFLCPADERAELGKVSYLYNDGSAALRSNYDGTTEYRSRRIVKAADCVDGTSQTALLAERLIPLPQAEINRDDVRSMRFTSTTVTQARWRVLAEQCLEAPEEPYLNGPDGRVGLRLCHGYSHALPPNRAGCYTFLNGGIVPNLSPSVTLLPASSRHSGGVNTAMADGAVRLVSDTVDLDVWRAAGTRAGGEPEGTW